MENGKIKNYVTFGVFKLRAEVEECVEELKSNGFRNSDISALFQSGDSSKDFAHEAGTKLPEGASTGALSGALLGGTLGWLAGIGTLAIPGVGPLIAAGPIMATLAGAGVGGTIGGVGGALIGFGLPEYEAKRYEGSVKEGGILLSAHCDNSEWCDKAEEIFANCGAENISSTREGDSAAGDGTVPFQRHGNL